MEVSVKLDYKGNLFKLGGEPAKRALEGALRELVEMGEGRLNEVLRPRPAGVFLSVAEADRGKVSTGNYRRNLQSKVTSLHGIITDGGDVEYGPWLEGTGSRNQTTRFKGYHSFRKTAQWMQEQASRVLQAYVNRAVEKLNE